MVIEGGHKISIEFEDYQIRKVTVEAKTTETLNFHFAKTHGNICVDGVNVGNVEHCELSLEKGSSYQILVS